MNPFIFQKSQLKIFYLKKKFRNWNMRALYNINFNESTASSAAIWAKQAEALINNYAICVVSIVGTVLNLFTLLLLANNSFKHKFYDFLRCRCLCNLVVCAFGIAYVDVFCRECPVNYVRLLLYSVLVHIPVRMAFLASAISDVLLIINRLLMLYDKKESGIYKLTKKVGELWKWYYRDLVALPWLLLLEV